MNSPLVGARTLLLGCTLAAVLAGCGSSGDSSNAPELSAPAKLTLVSGDAQSVSNGPAAAAAPLIVMVTDPKNRPLKDVTVTWTASDPTAKLSAGTSNTDAAGQAQVTWTLGETAGVQSVTATVSQIAGERVVFQGKNAVTSISGSVARSVNPPITVSAARTAGTLLKASNRGVSTRAMLSGNSVTYSASDMRAMLNAHRAPMRRLIVHIEPSMIGATRAFATSSHDISMSRDAVQRTVAKFQTRGLVMRAEISPVIMAARVTVPDSVDMQAAMRELSADASVASIEVDSLVPMLGDYSASEGAMVRASDVRPGTMSAAAAALTIPNDPFLLNQYWHYNLVDAFKAWGTTTGNANVLVAVVDQGVRFDHPSMAANLTHDGYNFVAAGNRLAAPIPLCATSGTGTSAIPEAGPSADPTLPDDFTGISSTGCLVRNTLGDHGLHVSGTIGAPGNDAVGAAGLNWSVSIRPVRVLDATGSGFFFDIAQGLLYAAGLPAAGAGGAPVTAPSAARIINMSLGGSTDSPTLRAAVQAVTDAGALIIASAGNGSTNAPSFPAAYPQVLSVVALGPDLQLATYTNVGTNVSLSAPGGDFRLAGGTGGVLSTTFNYVTQTPNYAFYTGTSMASPHVTGIAALLLAANPTMTAAQLRQRLQSTAVDVGPPGRDDRYGFGIVNAYNALNNITSANAGKAAFVRIVDAATGDTAKTVAANTDGSFSVTKLPAGSYYLVAGEDDAGDKKIGIAGRRFGWFGGAAPAPIALTAGQSALASVTMGTPLASKPNATFATASRLIVNSYAIDQVTTTDPVATFVVQLPKAGVNYTFETSGVLGTCGLGLELDTVLELYDSAQTLKARSDNVGMTNSVFCSQISTATLAPGTYYLRVLQSPNAAPGSAGGQFRIAVRDQ